jgi:8-oxo-dGTP pyrophosphatase MutT (NUDIX family)
MTDPIAAVEGLRALLNRALARRPRLSLDRGDLIAAAVLVPITDRGGPHLLFTKKSEAVPHHKGQFAFPGGICEARDASRVETALREAREEIGLPPETVEVLGLLDDTATRATPFVITPVVGLVREPPPAFRPDGREIERVIEVPLDRLRDPGIYRREIWERDGERQPVHFFDVSVEDVIWGATARILRQLLDLIEDEAAPA